MPTRNRNYSRDRNINRNVNDRNYKNRNTHRSDDRNYAGKNYNESIYENENYGPERRGSTYSEGSYRRNKPGYRKRNDDRNFLERTGDRIKDTWDRWTDRNDSDYIDRDYKEQYLNDDDESVYARGIRRGYSDFDRDYDNRELRNEGGYNRNDNEFRYRGSSRFGYDNNDNYPRIYNDSEYNAMNESNYNDYDRGRREFDSDYSTGRRRRRREYSM